MKSIQESLIASSMKRMEECKKRGDKDGFYKAKGNVEDTLLAIDNVDQKCYDKYRYLLEEDM